MQSQLKWLATVLVNGAGLASLVLAAWLTSQGSVGLAIAAAVPYVVGGLLFGTIF